MKVVRFIFAVSLLTMAQSSLAQIEVGDTKITGGGMFTAGYNGDYGDEIQSSHGLNLGMDGQFSGSYYNPNFLSFNLNPYWGQSRADSSNQSLSSARGVNGTANFFTGSHFPGSVHYDYAGNSTGTFGLEGQPNFTTRGTSQGFGIGWSALLPNLPSLSVSYSQGSGHSTIFGTDQMSDSRSKLFNVHSAYDLAGFHLTGFYDRDTLHSQYPQFLVGEEDATQDSSGHDFGFAAQHKLTEKGTFSISYTRASATGEYFSPTEQGSNLNSSSYTDSIESANANFHPSSKLSLNFTQNYTNNLSGYFAQQLGNGTVPATALNLGSGSYSLTVGGGVGYSFSHSLFGSAQATYYDQHYFGRNFTGQYLSGTVNYGKRVLDTFTFSASVIDSSSGMGDNAVGFIGNINAFRRFAGWETSGDFSYSQNVQSFLITYTTSSYSYSARLRRKLPAGMNWIAAFNGSHSGLTQEPGSNNHSESYSTSLSGRRWTANGLYTKFDGVSLLGAGGVISPVETPGLTDFILFNGSSYGGGVSVTPFSRLSLAGNFSRAISDTMARTNSNNSTKIISAQMQYHLRKISLLAGYTRFTQGISAIGAPVNATSYFAGISRWFDFF